uniref:Mitochondrial carrier protein n=1 Tax=Timspurckia oligopyrenoides TaxID=708627 RepID=A0A7S1ERM4_9RHOD|mmetsp:Transcript_3086/g.5439  ORF Transcript_3086/g.5439 Transcript_3086/m.5439 type:complete len:341 (+) Transcript_3086:84-1106(+)|eukprot:CAMPEP_0182452446 /NCGR_PEP_ID=MMETSP1172-20130603/44256_1 /TAXON_ID=708627 /ORGANISM="Timspurckia oligopyrenoides, Strain CCMP3278" /LENGTH=340 /DNA_ID=CAMNT_0024650279 /DNA_START=35 /DNA_END=1057 /DNA_ORIENTATION=+
MDANARTTTQTTTSSSSSSSTSNATTTPKVLSGQQQIASLFSGALAGTVASTITCPLEVVKTQLQSGQSHHRSIYEVAKNIAINDGYKGFFRGLTPTVVGIIPARATYFWAYSFTKAWMIAHTSASESSSLVHMNSAAVASIASNTVTNPIWLVKTRMQLQVGSNASNSTHQTPRYGSYAKAIQTIFKDEGITGFWKGISASYWGVSESVLHFVIYEKLKTLLREHRRTQALASSDGTASSDLGMLDVFGAAASAKLVASAATYPHEVVRTRMREERSHGHERKYRTMISSLTKIYKEEGRRGLYSGLHVHLLRVVPNTAIMFLTYEFAVQFLTKYSEKS